MLCMRVGEPLCRTWETCRSEEKPGIMLTASEDEDEDEDEKAVETSGAGGGSITDFWLQVVPSCSLAWHHFQ